MIGKLSVGAVFLLFLPLPWTDDFCLSPPTPEAKCTRSRQENQGCRGGRLLRLALGNFGHMQNVECFGAEARSHLETDAYPGRWAPWLHHGHAPDPHGKAGQPFREGLHCISKWRAELGVPRRASSDPADNIHSVSSPRSHLQSYCLN